MHSKIIPIKTEHALAESVVFFTLSKKAATYIEFFKDIYLSNLIDKECVVKRTQKRSSAEIALLKNDNIIWKIIFVDKCIGVECHEYTRWNKFFDIAKNIFSNLDAFILNDIKGIGLYVEDGFDVMMEKETGRDFALNELFNKKSKFIVPVFFDTKYPPALSAYRFHEHNIQCKNFSYCLENDIKIIANFSDSGLNFIVAHRQISSFRDKKGKIGNTDIREIFETLTQVMHERNKEYVSNILEKDVLKSIGLM